MLSCSIHPKAHTIETTATSSAGTANHPCGPRRLSPTADGGYNRTATAASNDDEPAAPVASSSPLNAPGAMAAVTASASSQPIAPANRGSVTVAAQGNVETSTQARTLPDASAAVWASPVTNASTPDTA